MSPPYSLFQRFGVELEYMIVDRRTLALRPIADELIKAVAGEYSSDVELGPIAWSNELVLHVIELKTNGPAEQLDGLATLFQQNVTRMNEILAAHDACLLPTAMHPWMDPDTETRLWPHEYNAVYAAFNRVFDCRGHGWSNVQSTHLNLPFADDTEFGRLHAAIRLLLPILPALAASSPIAGGLVTGMADTRMEYYRTNSRRIPSVAGLVIPEPVFTAAEYAGQILRPAYRDIAPHDPEGTLQHEWLNARGAIARFERNTIEIRVLDIQECPQADLAVVALLVAALRALVAERWLPYAEQRAWGVAPLHEIFLATIRDADEASIANRDYLRAFGLADVERCPAAQIWQHLAETCLPAAQRAQFADALDVLFAQGTLARRILRAVSPDASPARLADVYGRLRDCLREGTMFEE